jgi:hypothetical protein
MEWHQISFLQLVASFTIVQIMKFVVVRIHQVFHQQMHPLDLCLKVVTNQRDFHQLQLLRNLEFMVVMLVHLQIMIHQFQFIQKVYSFLLQILQAVVVEIDQRDHRHRLVVLPFPIVIVIIKVISRISHLLRKLGPKLLHLRREACSVKHQIHRQLHRCRYQTVNHQHPMLLRMHLQLPWVGFVRRFLLLRQKEFIPNLNQLIIPMQVFSRQNHSVQKHFAIELHLRRSHLLLPSCLVVELKLDLKLSERIHSYFSFADTLALQELRN